ncbi:protein kinase domain-containing protein [Streptomyces xanthii]|uniref:Protein kinase n=1 Tax=Streptomyces xanthii TaxID=2768069 RepID=A0A7H1BAA2_9ACTN|nr:protein kinase [Streptomyces xanthii]QNS05657.1 protein kinase [Streptomyces xanthii]
MPLAAEDPRVIGDYVLLDRLGSGGMGVVYEAQSTTGRQVALKVVHQELSLDDEFRTRFRQEVAAARRVSGAYTAAVVDADPEAARPWMATSFVTGETLDRRVFRHGPLRGPELRRLAVGLGEALRDIHRARVVHRDLKPANIVLSPDGPRVIDFGISRAAGNQTLTATGQVMGTPPFMSPEQFSSPKDVGPASDLFSLASVLVYATTERGPFTAESPFMTAYQVVHEEPDLTDVPAALRKVIAPCFAKRPQDRPGLRHLLAGLRALPDEDEVPDDDSLSAGRRRAGYVRTTLDRPRLTARTRRRRRGLRTGVAVTAAAAVLVGGGVWAAYESRDSPAPAAAVGGTLPAGWQGPWRAEVLPAGSHVSGSTAWCHSAGDSLLCEAENMAVTRIRIKDGSVAWRHGGGDERTGYTLLGTGGDVAVEGRLAYSRGGELSGGTLLGVSRTSGRTLWTARQEAEHDGVAVTDDLVLTRTTPSAPFEARDLRTGERRWTFRPTGLPRGGHECAPHAVDGRLFVSCTAHDGHAAVYELSRGGTARTLYRKAGAKGRLVPVAADGSSVVLADPTGDDGPLRYYRVTASGAKAGGLDLTLPVRTQVTVTDGTVYAIRPTGRASAHTVADGRRLWSTSLNQDDLSAPEVAGDVLLTATGSGRTLAVDRRTGATLWSTDRLTPDGSTGEEPEAPRVWTSGRAVLVATAGARVHAFDAKTPTRLPR